MMNEVISIQKLMNDFSKMKRSHYVGEMNEKESNVLHSMSVALLGWKLCDALNLPLNREKILQYALVHDIVEIYAGDTHAFADEDAKKAKVAAEIQSLARLENEFTSAFPTLVKTMQDYHARANDESHFVWTVDKIQALVQAITNAYRSCYEEGLTLASIQRVHGTYVEKSYPPLRAYYNEMLESFSEGYQESKVHTSGQPINHQAARETSMGDDK